LVEMNRCALGALLSGIIMASGHQLSQPCEALAE
jgi:hypothetical protein